MADEFEQTDFSLAIENKIRAEERTLIQATDWADFKERVGRIKAYKGALEISQDVAKHMREYDEDDEDIDED